ncbi:hypothetical protein [Microvirga massiliensis]|uniref:hypothetical protein n=1 Tax=Microvirga massiliensis TaxID=1033741 RepID=UPI00062BAB06|nr:hypothetical protein [Microvirga massiliensis]
MMNDKITLRPDEVRTPRRRNASAAKEPRKSPFGTALKVIVALVVIFILVPAVIGALAPREDLKEACAKRFSLESERVECELAVTMRRAQEVYEAKRDSKQRRIDEVYRSVR